MVSTTLPDLDQLDIEAWKALVVERHELLVETLSSQTQQIEHLKLVIEKLRRMMFGSKSEKVTIQVEQFELQLEETETEQAAAEENNPASVSEAFRRAVGYLWRTVLCRRSQGNHLPWRRMQRYIARWFPSASVCHPYPLVRLGVLTQGGSRMR